MMDRPFLAILDAGLDKDGRDGRQTRPIVVRWAAQHPEAEGFIAVTSVPDLYPRFGATFFKIEKGEVTSVSYAEAMPKEYQQSRAGYRAEWEKGRGRA